MSAPRAYDDSGIGLGDLMRGERATLGKSLLDVQRDLKIKAKVIAAIENVDAEAFESPGFISGYLRSYARYLGMDPDRAFEAFCAESGFRPAHGMSRPGGTSRKPSHRSPVTLAADRDIFADRTMPYALPREALFSRVEPGAIGSLAVLVALTGAIGWGGWQLLQEMQQVTIEEVGDEPVALAEVDPLAPLTEEVEDAPATPAPDALDRLYRPRALEVPVLVARDGPIGTLDPEPAAAAPPAAPAPDAVARSTTPIDGAVLAALSDIDGVLDAAGEEAEPTPQVVADPGEPLTIVAVRPSWVRVRAPDGTVVLEKIMEAGETYAVPRTEVPATLRTGNAGSIYFRVGDRALGPAGDGPTIVSGLELSHEAVMGSFAAADLEGDPELARLIRVAEAARAE